MRWVLIALCVLAIVGLWVLAFFVPSLLWFAELLTAAAVLPVVAVLLIQWIRARLRRSEAARAAQAQPPARRPEVAALQGELRRTALELQRIRGGQSAAEKLPWYVAFGAPSAGTSAMLDRLGLAVVAAPPPPARASAAPAVALRCPLRSSAEAAVVDVPARLTDEEDRDAWLGLLSEIRRIRGDRPVEGLLVAVSVSDFMSETSPPLELAARLRSRLEEALERLEMILPVYLVITKADLLPGFHEYWSNDAKTDESAWGASFPIESLIEHEPVKAIDREFDALVHALHVRMLNRLPREGDPARRVRILRFPLEFRALKAPVGHFVEALCRGGAAPERFVFRGFYLTSAGVSGLPGPLAQGGLALGGGPRAPEAQAPKAYFLRDVLRSVVLPDRNLGIPTGTSLKKRAKREQRLSIVALAVSLAVLLPALASYVHNAQLAVTVESVARALRSADAGTSPGRRGNPVEPGLDTLVDVEADAKSFGIAGWFGPRAARDLREPLDDAYTARLHAAMVEHLRPAMDKQLDTIAWGPVLGDIPSTPDDATPLRNAYELLKLYATLVHPMDT